MESPGMVREGVAAAPEATGGVEVREELERILASRWFAPSRRLCRFLRWTVEHSLAGDADALKEYSLGRDVFDRGDQYDPKIDSIVRVEAYRLRKKLRQYYASEGRNDAAVIEFPEKGYVPVFRGLTGATEEGPAAAAFAGLDPLTVAVLPFRSIGAGEDQDSLCEGIAEEILGELAGVPELKVLARTSTFAYADTNLDLREIGLRLGAGTLLDGSVRLAGQRLRVSVRAFDARSGQYIWTHRFSAELTDILKVEVEIAKGVAAKLGRRSREPARSGAAPPAASAEAYMLYLRGRKAWHQFTIESCRAAIANYQQAISASPGYAQAYGALAIAYTELLYLGALKPAEANLLGRRAAVEALRLDPECADATIALGSLTGCLDWNWPEGERLLQSALSLRGGRIVALSHLAVHYAARGQIDACRATIGRMVELDPLARQAQGGTALLHYLTGNYEEAARWLEQARLISKASHFYTNLGRTLVALGRVPEAIRRLEEVQGGTPNPLLMGALAEVLAMAGQAGRAEEILRKLRELAAVRTVSPLAFVYAYTGLAEWNEVLDWLERATEAGWAALAFLPLDPRYEPVRSEPRFQGMLQRMHLV